MRLMTGVVSGVGAQIDYIYRTTTLYPLQVKDSFGVSATGEYIQPIYLSTDIDNFHISSISIGGTNTITSVVETHNVYDIDSFNINSISIGGTNTITSVVETHDVYDIDNFHINSISIGGTNTITQVVVNHDVYDVDNFHISSISIGGTNTIN